MKSIMSNLGSIEVSGKHVNLDTASLEKLKMLFEKVSDSEEMLKQEMDTILRRLM